jgi:two-component system sensor histidine kinase KdpD
MNESAQHRLDPDAILKSLHREDEQSRKGKLKIFFGMCAGVGKTYDMLKEAQLQKSKGVDVVIGIVETHGRAETEALLEGLPLVSRKRLEYKGVAFTEMDIDAVIARRPALVLVDELAHTNVQGSRHAKRYQDILELLENGINVYSTLNVQHLESRADTVAQITGSIVRETVPDSIFEAASDVEVIDISTDDLLKRMEEGKVYTPERSQQAIQNFFRKENLTALREMALRLTAERVDHQLRELMHTRRIAGPWKSGQRLVVAVSPSPHAVKLIRWARRTAYTMDASWVCVYVETPKLLVAAAKDQLRRNLKLALELGAEIVTTTDSDVASAVLRVAREQNATQVLIGKTLRLFPLKKSLLDKLIEQSGELDVYVIGGDQPSERARKLSLVPEIQSGIAQYFAALGLVALVSALCFLLRDLLGYRTVSLVLLFVVALLPLRLGAGPVLIAAAFSALAWNFFFIPPTFTFVISQLQDMLMFAMYFCIAAITGVLTARVRSREQAIRVRERRATALYTLTHDLSLARSQDEVAKAAVVNIQKQFDAEVVILLSQIDGDIFTEAHPASTYKIDEKEFNVAAWVYWNEKKAGKFTDTLPSSEATYFPLKGPRYPLGVVGVKSAKGEALATEQDSFLQNFITQISSALEREQLNEVTKRAIVLAESERLYKALFNSISHELRTPIATILGSAETLIESKPDHGLHDELVDQVHRAALRLQRLVENLLDMSRLESGLVQPRLDWCDVNDLVSTTLRKLQEDLTAHTIQVDVAPDVPLIRADFGLLQQALANLLHNATLYSPQGTRVDIRASVEGEKLIFEISDCGPGIPSEMLQRIFEKFYRVPGTKAGGTGLGLSIAKGFVEAHRGTLTAMNKPNGGARFLITLPIRRAEKKMMEVEE